MQKKGIGVLNTKKEHSRDDKVVLFKRVEKAILL